MKKRRFRFLALVFICFISLLFFTIERAWTQDLTILEHISWGWIHDFEFYEDGIFISPYNGGIGYFEIDNEFNLTHSYTINPGGSHQLAQFCVADSFLYALDGSMIHSPGTPTFFVYQISNTGYLFLADLEPCGTIWAQFDPIIYYNDNIIFHNYPGDYFRIDVSQPADPVLTGSLYNTSDVCHDIIPYQDTLLIATRQSGTGFWNGNFRIIRNNLPDEIISLGTYGANSYTYTSGAINIGSILFTSHLDGLRVYDLSNLGNVQQIYFYSTAWGRCVTQINNYIFMGCNDGWHLFEYSTPDIVQHLEYLANDTRILRMRLKLESEELWCFVDGGSLGGLVVLDISGNLGIEENEYIIPNTEIKLQNYPNPFNPSDAGRSPITKINFSVLEDSRIELKIYNLKGQLVKTLVNERKSAGLYDVTWDGKDNDNKNVCSGIYLYQLIKNGETIKSRKMLLLK